MKIKNYILESEKQYRLRLKTVVPLDDAAMDIIEMAVMKYQPLEISRPRKTILQSHPMDFTNVLSAEVYIVDMVFGLPVSSNVMREDIRKALNAPEVFVVVRYENEAPEIEGQRKDAINKLETERNRKGLEYAALLDTGNSYPEAQPPKVDDFFGDEYNGRLTAYLAQIRKERSTSEYKAANAPFSWMDIPDRHDQEPVQDDTYFNDMIPGALKIVGKNPTKDKKIQGAISDQTKITRLYKDKKGNRFAASVMMEKQKTKEETKNVR